VTQSGRKGEGKAAGAAGRRLRNFMGRRSRDITPVKKRCGKQSRQMVLAGSQEGSIFAMPFLPSADVGRYLPDGDSSLGDFVPCFILPGSLKAQVVWKSQLFP